MCPTEVWLQLQLLVSSIVILVVTVGAGGGGVPSSLRMVPSSLAVLFRSEPCLQHAPAKSNDRLPEFCKGPFIQYSRTCQGSIMQES